MAELDDLSQRMRPQVPQWPHLKAWLDACPHYWGGFLLRPVTRRWDLDQLSAVPMRSGIYALVAGGRVAYIGRSGSLRDRLQAHCFNSKAERSPLFDRFMFRMVPEHAVEAVEIAHIRALEPERNQLYERPEWCGHGAMVAALRQAWNSEAP